MTVDIKGIGSAIRGRADAEEADTTILAKSEKGKGSLTVSVDPEGDVDMTFCMKSGESCVSIHGGEAMVEVGGNLRLYRIDEGMKVAGLEGEASGDAMLIQSAKAMFDQVLDEIEVEDLEKFNPFEEGTS